MQITNEVRDDVNQEYREFAVQEAGAVEQWVEQNQQYTRLISESEKLHPGGGADAGEREQIQTQLYMQLKRESIEDAVELVLVDLEDETVVVTSTDSSERSDVEGKPVAETTFADAPWTGDLSFDSAADVHVSDAYEVGGETAVAFTSKVVGANVERALVLVVGVDGVSRDFRGGERTQGGYTQVVDADGRVVFDETRQEYLQPYAGNDAAYEPIDEARTQGQATVRTNEPTTGVMDEPYVAGYAPVAGTDWVVVVHGPRSEAYVFVTNVSRLGWGATVLGLLLVVGVGTVFGRWTGRDIDRLTERAQRMEEGTLDVDLDTDREDNIGRLYHAFANMRGSLREQIRESRQASQEAERARQQAEETNRQLLETADEYSETMEAVAEGNLTQRLDTESGHEAMAEIGRAFNAAVTELEARTEQVKAFARDVATASEEVTASSEEVRSASEQVTESIQEIARYASETNTGIQEISEATADQATSTQQVVSMVDDAADISQHTSAESESAAAAAEEQTSALTEVTDSMQSLALQAERLSGALDRFETGSRR
jgi:methyl-accepting chemotaxis protein